MYFLDKNLFVNSGNKNLNTNILNKEINDKTIEKTEEVVEKVIANTVENTSVSDLGSSVETNILVANKNISIEQNNSIKYGFETQTQTVTKNVEINTDAIISNCSLALDYRQNLVRTTPSSSSSAGTLSSVKNLAKKDLNSLAEELKLQIQKQMGEQFDETKIQNLINESIQKTINDFSLNILKSSSKPNQNTNSFVIMQSGFGGLRNSGVYNIQALCNSFFYQFQ